MSSNEAQGAGAAGGRWTLVTGGAGFVGSNLTSRLAGEGRRVRILDNLSRPGVERNADWLRRQYGERIEIVRGDVRDEAALETALRDVETVFHFAAQVAVTTSLDDPRDDFQVNLEGTFGLLEAVRRRPCPPRLFFTSTNKVYGALPDIELRRDGQRYVPANEEIRSRGVSEERPLDFHSPYGCSKGAADQYVLDYSRSYGLETVVFRMSCIYGPRQFGTEDQGWVAFFLLRALAGKPITLYGDGRQVRDILFVEDLVEAFLQAERKLPEIAGRAFNVGGGPDNTVSLLELLDLIARAPALGSGRAAPRPRGSRPPAPGSRGRRAVMGPGPLGVKLFCHSLESDWNHGNAHFLRGICRALQERGHRVTVWEPRDGWSRENLIAGHGAEALRGFREVYPDLRSHLYDLETLDLDRALDGADLVLVHEWNPPELVHRLGEHRRNHGGPGGYRLLFHDTHHRSASEPASLAAYDLDGYDGVLAFGGTIRERYLKRGWAERVWVWHEAADVTVFRPLPEVPRERDLVWIGNWGDGERTAELHEFLLEPARKLGLNADAWGVRYPEEGLTALREAGFRFHGWLPNHRVPEEFARHRFTLHIPRRPYVERLPGIPTIRVFEALACGIPLICAPWHDSEGLFQPGRDYLAVSNGEEMQRAMRSLLADPALGGELAAHGRATVLARHTCCHRVDELLAIYFDQLAAPEELAAPALQEVAS